MMKKQSRSQEKPLKKFEIKLKNLQNKNEDKKIVLASDAKQKRDQHNKEIEAIAQIRQRNLDRKTIHKGNIHDVNSIGILIDQKRKLQQLTTIPYIGLDSLCLYGFTWIYNISYIVKKI